jgi:hypothetical protein
MVQTSAEPDSSLPDAATTLTARATGGGSLRVAGRSDWDSLCTEASQIRIAGMAFSARIQAGPSGMPDIGEQVKARLRKKLAKALKSKLGEDYRIEVVDTAGGEIVVEVSALTIYSRSRLLLSLSRSPWPRDVDQGVEAMRRAAGEVLRDHLEETARLSATWTPGDGVLLEELPPGDDAPAAVIQNRLQTQRNIEIRLEFLRFGIIIAIAVLAGIATFTVIALDSFHAVYVLAYGLVVLLFMPVVQGKIGSTREQITEDKERLELRGLLDEEERRAFRLFQLHSLDLKRYYDLALSQRRIVFGLGVLCVVVGAGIAVTALLLLSETTTSTEENILVAGIGAIGAILSNFVAVVYLKMFRDTVGSMNIFHTRLVATHHLLFGNLLAARISSKELRDETLASMAASVADVEPSEAESSRAG